MSTEEDVLRRTRILVLGHRRPRHLRDVLESLRRQNALGLTHVWLDGHSGFAELTGPTLDCERVAREYQPAEITVLNGHLGIEKLMLDALGVLCRRWEALIVLEDDCFPTSTAIAEFAAALSSVRDREDIFSVYGHHFLVPGEEQPFPRFQGWGWAAWSARLLPVLTEARRCFDMPEPEFLAWVQEQMTGDVRRRLSVTPGRDSAAVVESVFAWDACFALLTARRGLMHCRTPTRVVFNCGMGAGSSHFPENRNFRLPPFNMISPDEVWDYFEPAVRRPGIEPPSYHDCAVVYVSSRDDYAREALASARSVRRAMPDIAIYLKAGRDVTTAGDEWKLFDRTIYVDELTDAYIDKYYFLDHVTQEKVLFLDADTYVVSGLRPGFDVLNRFDIACAHAPFRLAPGPGAEIPRPAGIPSAFPDFNTGVIFCRNTETIRRLFQICRETHAELSGGVEPTPDQPSFRAAVWNSDVSLYVLPPEYNARLCFPTFLSGEAKILHCRFPAMDRVADEVNANLGLRTFLPEELDEITSRGG